MARFTRRSEKRWRASLGIELCGDRDERRLAEQRWSAVEEQSTARHASRGEVRRDGELHLALSYVVIRTSGAHGRCHRRCMVTIESPCTVLHARVTGVAS
jgi:hypothetical protein